MQANFSIESWSAPDFSACHFKDCNLWAKFAGNFYRHNDPCAADPDKMHRYLVSGLPPHYRTPTRGEAATWYQLNCNYSRVHVHPSSVGLVEHMLHDITFDRFRYYNASDVCRAQMASELHLQGNPDIAGIGAMIAYLIEAFVVTIFVTARAVEFFRYGHRTYKTPFQACCRSIRDALRASMVTFAWASVLLCMGILIGSLHSLAAISKESVQDQVIHWQDGAAFAVYDADLAVLASIFCCLPVFSTLLLVQGRGQRRRLLHAAIMLSTAALLLVAWALYLRSASDRSSALGHNPSGIWIDGLPRNGPFPYVFLAGITIFTYLGGSGLLTLFVAFRNPPTWALPRYYKTSVSFLTHIFCLGMMWTTLFQLWLFRGYIDTGEGSSIAEWSFGQILALATWVPALVEFGYTFLFGIQEGLEGNMPTEYKAILNGQVAGIAAFSTDSLAYSQA